MLSVYLSIPLILAFVRSFVRLVPHRTRPKLSLCLCVVRSFLTVLVLFVVRPIVVVLD